MQKGFTIIVRCINNKQTETLTIQLIIRYWTKRLPQSCMRWNQISCIEAKKDQNILSELKKIRRNYVFTCSAVAPFHVSEIFDEVDDAYWMCSTLLQEIVNEHAPIKQKTIKGNHIPYMNGELRRAINVKRMLKRKFTKCNSNMNWDKYRKQRNIVTKLLKKSLQLVYAQKNATRLLMVVIFGKQLNHSSQIEVLTKMMIYLCLMMGKLLTTPMIYAEYSIIILRILLIA